MQEEEGHNENRIDKGQQPQRRRDRADGSQKPPGEGRFQRKEPPQKPDKDKSDSD